MAAHTSSLWLRASTKKPRTWHCSRLLLLLGNQRAGSVSRTLSLAVLRLVAEKAICVVALIAVNRCFLVLALDTKAFANFLCLCVQTICFFCLHHGLKAWIKRNVSRQHCIQEGELRVWSRRCTTTLQEPVSEAQLHSSRPYLAWSSRWLLLLLHAACEYDD